MTETNFKVINTRALFNGDYNPTLCLSVMREFNNCHKCERALRFLKRGKFDTLKCKPHIKVKYRVMYNIKRFFQRIVNYFERKLKK